MITEATPEQWEQIDKIRQKWIDLQAVQSTDEEIISVVHRMWKQIDGADDEPIVLIFDGPNECIAAQLMIMGMELTEEFSSYKFIKQIGDNTLTHLSNNIAEQCGMLYTLDSNLHDPLYQLLNTQLRVQTDNVIVRVLDSLLRADITGSLTAQGKDKLADHIHDLVYNKISVPLFNQLYLQLRTQLDNTLYRQSSSTLFQMGVHNNLGLPLYEQLDNHIANEVSFLTSRLRDQAMGNLLVIDVRRLYRETLRAISEEHLNRNISQTLARFLNRLEAQVYHECISQIGPGLLYSHETTRNISSQINNALEQISHQFHEQNSKRILDSIHADIYNKQRLEENLRKLKSTYYTTLWYRAWAGWYEGAKVLGVQFDQDTYDLFVEWSRCVPVLWPYKNLAVVSRKPINVHWQDELLHNESGPSVEFKDGFKVWTINGVQVDEQIVMAPETQTLEQINSEQNEEIKRIRIERFAGQDKDATDGWIKYVQEMDGKIINKRTNDTEATEELLMECGNMKLFIPTCKTGRIFAIEVSPECETCEQAQNYLWAQDMLDPVNVIGRS